jgi:uncharacterized protein (DUF433 family)
MDNWRNHITANPAILAGKPIIKETRIAVAHFLISTQVVGQKPTY